MGLKSMGLENAFLGQSPVAASARSAGMVKNGPARARYRSGLTPESMRLILLISASR